MQKQSLHKIQQQGFIEPTSKSHIGDKAIAVVVSVTALVPLPGVNIFTGSILAACLLFPVLIAFLRYERRLLKFVWLAMAVVVMSPLSAALAGASEAGMPQWEWVTRPLSLAISVIVIYWSSQTIGVTLSVILAIPGPMLFDLVTRSSQGNNWKYAASVWVTVGLLVLVHKLGLVWKMAAVFAIVILSALNDTRGIIIMVAAGALVELLSRTGKARMYRVVTSSIATLLLVWSIFQLALAGVLGSNIQHTMIMQTQRGPMALLRTARPESGGNISLVFSDPLRFIISDSVTAEQAAIVRNSFAQVDRDPNSLYVDRGILHGAELHSVAADLWLHLGTVGLLLAVLFFGFFLLLGFQGLRSNLPLTTVVVFIALRGMWDLLFSPVSDTRFWPLFMVLGLVFMSLEKGSNAKTS
ncbi:hypothetical protein [Arthrobacter sp. HS15c]|uniref:hypothetical protein n=1 Tax=Arthrobacter sp. HS15c TaxID=3230279 RepID=UPI0034667036